MPPFSLRFLGSFHVSAQEKPITDFRSDKVRALLAYLAVEPYKHQRTALAALLWPDIGHKYALTNLRNTLHRLRQTLDAAVPDGADALLRVDRQSICFQVQHADVDVLRMQKLLESSSFPSSSRIEQLEEAVNLYRGELLTGFGISDAMPFEEWLLLRRELLHQQSLVAFSSLIDHHETAGNYERAYATAGRLLSLDPYLEETHRQIMRLLARMGRADQALQQLEQMRQLLRKDLNVDPSAETLALAEEIAGGVYMQTARRLAEDAMIEPVDLAPARSGMPSPGLDLRDIPLPSDFFGRTRERQQVAQWLLHEHSRVVAILGLGGMGKTTLAAQCIYDMAMMPRDYSTERPPFDAVFWRSLVNAPPLTELLPPLLQIISEQQLTEIPSSLDEQIRLLLGYLRRKRVLLIFDNMESILDAGAYRPGYEGYGQFIQQMAALDHQSHLLLTSRERPHGYGRMERDGMSVRILQLAGIDSEAGLELLAQRGMQGEGEREAALVKRYSGNPLALKLVADTIEDIFGGDLNEFLCDDTLIFDDIRAVLDQHFERLTDLEKQILYWLAVEREPVSPQALRRNLLQPPMQHDFLEALRKLHRRSLVEQIETSFTLQNVVTEYLTERLVEAITQEIEIGQFHLLHRHALLKAQSKVYVRESQARLILSPIVKQLHNTVGGPRLRAKFDENLAKLREAQPHRSSYAAGNLLNLLLQCNLDPEGTNFSSLPIRQAYLSDASLPNVNFAHAEMIDSTFSSSFGRVKAIAISPDSQFLAVGTDDKAIGIWRLADGQQVHTLQGHRSLVISLDFSPDSRQLVSSSSLDAAVVLWDVERGSALTRLHGHQGGVEAVRFSPDGSVIASGGQDGDIRLWDRQSGQLLMILQHHTDWVTDIAFHPSGRLLASSGLDQDACILWQLPTSNEQSAKIGATQADCQISTLQGHDRPIRAVAFSPDGSLLATCSADHTIRLWDVSQQVTVHILRNHSDEVRSLAFSPDSSFLASASDDFTVRLWDVADGQLINVLHKHNHRLWAVALSGDGRILASGGSDGLVHIWELQGPHHAQIKYSINGNAQPIYMMALNHRGDCFATGEDDGRVRLWGLSPDFDQAEPLRLLSGHSELVDSLAFSSDGRWLVSGAHDNSARLWEIATGKCIERLYNAEHSTARVAFQPNGNQVARSNFDQIQLWEMSETERLRLTTVLTGHLSYIRCLAFSLDGQYLASYSVDDTVRLWDIVTGACLHIFKDVSSLWSLAFSPNGELLAAGGRSGIHLWNLRAPRYPHVHSSAMAMVTNIRPIAFSSDGKRLVSGGIDRIVRVWDLENDREVHALEGHTADVTATLFMPGGTTVISCGYDGTIRLWDVRHADSGRCLRELHIPGPYEGMDITGVTGISEAQRTALLALGAVENRYS
ncbi:MAG: hypothetical protein KF753_02480 [Caldilineaceae bacterium]|nr:hypothetical protein [Caldilineaceae bacterium]